MNEFELKKEIFAKIFLLSNKLQLLGDEQLGSDDLTVKQWFLILAVMNFDYDPMITEVSELIGYTRQNIKKLAKKLEEKKYIKIYKDEKDKRIVRLKIQEKNNDIWKKRELKDSVFINNIFSNIDKIELETIINSFDKILKNIKNMESENND